MANIQSMSGYTYILANKRMGTLYIGVTSDLARRVWEHKNNITQGFSSRYQTHMLVWYQCFERIEEAIVCEKRMKEWRRDWKVRVIEEMNPSWKDLSEELNG